MSKNEGEVQEKGVEPMNEWNYFGKKYRLTKEGKKHWTGYMDCQCKDCKIYVRALFKSGHLEEIKPKKKED